MRRLGAPGKASRAMAACLRELAPNHWAVCHLR